MLSQALAQELETAVQIHADRFFCQSTERGDFAAGAAFDQPQEQRLSIGFRQLANRGQCFCRLVLLIRAAPRERTINERGFHGCATDEIDRMMSRQCPDPAAECRRVAKRRKARPRAKKYILRKIAGRVRGDAGEQDRVHEPAEAHVQLPERVAIAGLRRADERNVVGQKLPCSRIRIV